VQSASNAGNNPSRSDDLGDGKRSQALDGGGAAGDAKMKRYLIKIFEKMQQSNANPPSIESPSDQLTEHASSVHEHNQ